MDGNPIKTGCLMKSGPKKFQPWRKRWFMLTTGEISYFSSKELTEPNLLGDIKMADVKTVNISKEKKHSFEIVTEARTYYMQGKSDDIRDEWIEAIQNTIAGKPDSSSSPVAAAVVGDGPVYAEVGPGSVSMSASEEAHHEIPDNTATSETTLVHKSRPESSWSFSDENAQQYAQISRTTSVAPPSNNDNNSAPRSLGARSLSEGMKSRGGRGSASGVVGLLHDMSIEEDDVSVLYKQIDATLDAAIEEEEEEYEVEEEEVEEDFKFSLPAPRDGKEMYAFDEIKALLGVTSCEENEVEDDDVFASPSDGNDEYPAIAMLSSYLKNSSLVMGLS